MCCHCHRELSVEETNIMENSNRRRSRSTIIVVIVLAVLLLLAGVYALLGKEGDANFQPTTASTRPVLYAMDFENVDAFLGWHVGGPGLGLFWLENTQQGKYVFEFPSGFVETEDLQFADIEVSVDVEFYADTPTDASVSCRLQTGQGYGFRIGNDGRWAITKSYQSQWVELAQGWSDVIQPDYNRLAGRCVGEQLTLLVNGMDLGSAVDSDMTIGGINLSYNAAEAGAGAFDNLLVEDWGEGKTPTKPAATEIAAASTDTPTAVPQPSQTLTPAPILTSTATPEGLFYANHFEGTNVGFDDWIIHEIDLLPRHEHTNPAYTFAENEQNKLVIDSTTTETVYALYDALLPVASQSIASEMEFTGEGEAGFALICRYASVGWYELGIHTSGHWQIVMASVEDNPSAVTRTVLAEGDSKAIAAGANTIEAFCPGSQLTLSVNGQELASIEDKTIQDGAIFGAAYSEDSPGAVMTQIAAMTVLDADGKKILDLNAEVDSFFFVLPRFASFIGVPGELSALWDFSTTITNEQGRAKITTSHPMQWIALYPHELPYNVEIALDVETELRDYNQGIGLVCRWNNQPAAYSGQNTGGYVLWILRTYVIVTPFSVDEFGSAHSTGPAEFSTTAYAGLLEGDKHHLAARCWNDLIEFYLDGELVAQHHTADFPYVGNEKVGSMAGVMFLGSDAGSTAWIDNLTFSWGLP